MQIDLIANPSGAALLIYAGEGELAGIRRVSSGAILLSFLSGHTIELPIAPELMPVLESVSDIEVVRLAEDGTRQTDSYAVAGEETTRKT